MTTYKFSPTDPASISLNGVTTGTGTVKAFNDCRQVNWIIEGSGTIDGGVIKIECAASVDYSGTWHELDSVNAVDLTGGGAYGNTFPMVPGGFVRARISENITGGGTVVVRLNGLLG
jgi:hypothetical protein